jgi:hypothetical protein
MNRKIVFIIVACLILMTMVYSGCSKKEADPFKKEGSLPDASTLTPEQIFVAKVEPMIKPLDFAVDVDPDNPPDDEAYRTVLSMMDMINEGEMFETLGEKVPGVQIYGLFNVKPADMPSERFGPLVKDVPAGGFSKIQHIPDHGFGVIYIENVNEDGSIDFGVIIVPTGSSLTETTSETTTGDGGTSTTMTPDE